MPRSGWKVRWISTPQFMNLTDLRCSAPAPENPAKRKRADSQYNHSECDPEAAEPNSDPEVLADVYPKARTKGPKRQQINPSSSDPEVLDDVHPKARTRGPTRQHTTSSSFDDDHPSPVEHPISPSPHTNSDNESMISGSTVRQRETSQVATPITISYLQANIPL